MQLNPISLAVSRILAGLSQAELSRRSGISQGHISGIEASDKVAAPATVVALASAIGVPVAALITDPTPEQIADARSRISKRLPLPVPLAEAAS